MNSLSDLTQPFLDALADRIDNWLIERRLKAIKRDKELFERFIEEHLLAIAELNREEINLRNQFFLPRGMSL